MGKNIKYYLEAVEYRHVKVHKDNFEEAKRRGQVQDLDIISVCDHFKSFLTIECRLYLEGGIYALKDLLHYKEVVRVVVNNQYAISLNNTWAHLPTG